MDRQMVSSSVMSTVNQDSDADATTNFNPVRHVRCAVTRNIHDPAAEYVLDCLLNTTNDTLAVSLSSNCIKLYDANTLTARKQIQAHDSRINQIRFAKENDRILYSCSADGTVRAWDTRIGGDSNVLQINLPHSCALTNEQADTFEEKSRRKKKKFLAQSLTQPDVAAIAIGGNNTLLSAAAGSTIAFYDIRSIDSSREPLGMFSESHFDRIQQLEFHPKFPQYLLSGGEDNLVNVFDIRSASEDDALSGAMNVESSVRSFGFFGDDAAFIWVMTGCESLSLWNVGSTERLGNFPWLPNTLRNSGASVDYLLDCRYEPSSQDLWLLTGDDEGKMNVFGVTPNKVIPGRIQIASAGARHSGPVRCTSWQTYNDVNTASSWFSGGEDGMVVQWSTDKQPLESAPSTKLGRIAKHNISSNARRKSAKPY